MLPHHVFDSIGEVFQTGGRRHAASVARDEPGLNWGPERLLRHYFAVQNLVSGVPLAIVSAWMGHSSVQLTVKRYGRWAHDAKEQWPWAALRGQPLKDVAQGRREIQLVR